MKSIEKYTTVNSEYYMYNPTPLAQILYIYPICVGYYEYLPGYIMQRSSYDSILFMEILEGECTIYGENGRYEARSGQTVIIDCYRPHGYEAGEPGWKANWIHINGKNITDYFLLLKNASSQNSTDNVFILNSLAAFRSIYSECFKALSDGNVKEATISAGLSSLMASIIDHSEKTAPAEKNEEIIARTISYINNNFTNDISLTDLAKMSNLSPYYFNRLFKKSTGYTPYEYVINTRLNHSKYLLKTTGLSVKETGFASGFASESRFCILFKEKTGMSPSEYRNAE